MPKASPYFTFLHFYRDEQRKKGRHMSLDEAKTEADPIWEALPIDGRERFVEMAAVKKPYIPRRNQAPRHAAPMSEHRQRMRGLIERVLATATNIRSHPFHFISFHRESNTRLPNEVSVLRFTMEKGAQCFLHFLLHPEISPHHYKLVSEKMNEPLTVIPIEGTQNSKENLNEVMSAIGTFTGGVAFTMTNENQHAVQCLTDLKGAAGPAVNRDIIPLDGEELITMLWERSRDGHNAQLLDVRDVCASQSGLDHLACEYHRACQNRGVCTLWKPYRLAYSLVELLAKPYNMEVAEGYHRSRSNWLPIGTYFVGKGSYEDWDFSSTTTPAWDCQIPSSSVEMRIGGTRS